MHTPAGASGGVPLRGLTPDNSTILTMGGPDSKWAMPGRASLEGNGWRPVVSRIGRPTARPQAADAQ